MSEVKPRQWFQARLRWAMLEKGRGLYKWRKAEHILLSEDRETAFQEALRIGYAGEYSLTPAPDQPDQKDAPTINCRFAMEYLEELGMGRTAFEVYLGEKPTCEVMDSITNSIRQPRCRPRSSDRAFSVTPASAPP